MAVLALALHTVAGAQAWPLKQPIKLVAVFPPGGSVDQVARILAPALQQTLGQTVVVDNKGGASGAIGTGMVAASAPDGYTFAVVFDTHGVNPSLQANMAFDTRKDLAMALLAKGDNLDLVRVPYRGGGPLMNDALAGHVQLSIGSVFLTKPHLDSKRLRPLAVTTTQRSSKLPDVPTVAESGYAGFDAPAWWALLAPARTPPEVVARMNEAINKVLEQSDVRDKLSAQGIDIIRTTPEAARVFIDRQIDIWAKVVRDNGIKAD